jgi:hypothetical protein
MMPIVARAMNHSACPVVYRLFVDRCQFCGFEYDLSRAAEAASNTLVGAEALAARLHDDDAATLRIRPEPGTWSPLEYGCHLRDVLLVQRERVLTARRTARPSFDPMGRDERVEHDGYVEQEPKDVARQLNDAAFMFAHVLSLLEPEDWDRTVMYNYPQRAERSLLWVAVHTEHEVRHHLRDVESQLA